jgi:hypothetical protein
MRRKTTARIRGRLMRRLALSLTLGAISYAGLGLTTHVNHAVAFANTAISRLTRDAASAYEALHLYEAKSDGTAEPTSPSSTGPTTTTTGSAAPVNGEQHKPVVARARLTSSVVGKHGDWTAIGLTGDKWTQPADALNLVAGSMAIKLPASCTGAFGNALVLSVDGNPVAFAAAPTDPASKTITMPFVVGTLSEPGKDIHHTLSAKFGSSCTKDGEDYTVTDVKVDVLEFR